MEKMFKYTLYIPHYIGLPSKCKFSEIYFCNCYKCYKYYMVVLLSIMIP